MMVRKNVFGLVGLSFLLILLAAGCRPEGAGGPGGETDSSMVAVDGDWVRIYHAADPDGLHPYNPRNAFATFIKENIYMYLEDFNSQSFTPEPTLAIGEPTISPDGLSFTYEMRPEARWDNGDPITGEDFAFSIKCILNPLTDNAQQKSYYSFLEDVIVDPSNPRRFTVVTNTPFFLAKTAIAGLEVISQKFYDPANTFGKYSVKEFLGEGDAIKADSANIAFSEAFNSEKYSEDPAFIYGSGPYRVESWTKGENVTLVKKKDWWGDQLRGKSYYFQAYPEKLVFKTIRDRATLPAIVKNGELDVVRDMSPDDFIASRDDTSGYIFKNFNFHTPSTYSVIYFGFNCRPSAGRKPLLSDPRVRKAIAHLTDYDNIINNVYNGFGKRQAGPISPLHTDEYDTNVEPMDFNPEKAKQLLDEAGWVDSDGDGVRDKMINGKKEKLEIEVLISNTGETGPRMLRIIIDQALKAGVVLNMVRLDFAELSQRTREHNFDMFGTGASASPLPTDLKQFWATENWVNNGSNCFGFGDSITDALIEEIRRTNEAEARTPLYHKFQRLWLEQMPAMMIMLPTERIWIHKRFRNANTTGIRPGYKPFEFWVPKAEQKFK